MIRRWLIRSLPLTLLTFCIVAWVGSYWRGFGIEGSIAGSFLTLGGGAGEALLTVLPGTGNASLHFFHSANTDTGYENI